MEGYEQICFFSGKIDSDKPHFTCWLELQSVSFSAISGKYFLDVEYFKIFTGTRWMEYCFNALML